jgi:hypothetical protein
MVSDIWILYGGLYIKDHGRGKSGRSLKSGCAGEMIGTIEKYPTKHPRRRPANICVADRHWRQSNGVETVSPA